MAAGRTAATGSARRRSTPTCRCSRRCARWRRGWHRRPGHHRDHAGPGEPAGAPAVRRRAGGLLRAASRGLRRGARVARRDRRRAPAPAGRRSGASGYSRLRRLFHDARRRPVAAFRGLEARGRIEIISSAATHGFLPLLARDESIRLQLAVGVRRAPPAVRPLARGLLGAGMRLPPAGRMAPGRTRARAPASVAVSTSTWPTPATSYFFVDAHLAPAGRPAQHLRAIRRTRCRRPPTATGRPAGAMRSPYRA